MHRSRRHRVTGEFEAEPGSTGPISFKVGRKSRKGKFSCSEVQPGAADGEQLYIGVLVVPDADEREKKMSACISSKGKRRVLQV